MLKKKSKKQDTRKLAVDAVTYDAGVPDKTRKQVDPVIPAVAIEEAISQYCQPITDEVNRKLRAAEAMINKGLAEVITLSVIHGMNIATGSIKRTDLKLSVNILFEITPYEIRKKYEQKAVKMLVEGIMGKK